MIALVLPVRRSWMSAVFLLAAGWLPGETCHEGPPLKTCRVFSCGHSFHCFLPGILADMAKAAGIQGHEQVGLSAIGGSQVIQHWNVPDEKNRAKEALRSGKVDVLTLSPIHLPDEGIEKFAALALAHNPNVRIAVQEDLFTDAIGHPKPALQALVAYCHFAGIYRRSPVGMPLPAILAKPGSRSENDKLNRLLQELAWDAVTRHPLSGVGADAFSQNRRPGRGVNVIAGAVTGFAKAADAATVSGDFYVAPDGNDTNPGTAAAAFATLARARDAVRRRVAEGLAHDLLVLIRGGVYRQRKTLGFGPPTRAAEKVLDHLCGLSRRNGRRQRRANHRRLEERATARSGPPSCRK